MPDEQGLTLDLVVIIGAAMGGGIVASYLRLPLILGYLVAGVIVGNYVPGLDLDIELLQGISELGVILLLFGLGIYFSPAKLTAVRRVAIVGGLIQIVLTIALVMAIGEPLGLDTKEAFVLGAAMALSSTAVVVKLLDARGELGAVYGGAAIGILLVQDLAVGPLLVSIPLLEGEGASSVVAELALAVGKTLLLLGGAYLLGTRIVPWLFPRIAKTGSRELFTLTVLGLAVGMASGSFALGLSLAFGAFLGGLVVSQSEFSHQTLADVLPMRDVFASIFFVSIGLLVDPSVVLEEPTLVLSIAAVLIVGKTIVTAGPVALLGYPVRTAVLVGLALSQAGEFSFIVARVGVDEGIISEDLNSALLMATLISILATPFLLQAGPAVLSWAGARPGLRRLLKEPVVAELEDESATSSRHVVICGFGRVGSELVAAVRARNFPCVVIEHDPYLIDKLRQQEVARVYGDATRLEVLEAAGLAKARMLAVTLPDPGAAGLVVRSAKRLNPRIQVVVRGRAQEDHDELLKAGASEVIHPEFEAGLEFVRHTLRRFGTDRVQIEAFLSRRRRDLYQR